PPRCRTDVAGEPYFNSKGDFSGPDGGIDCTVDEFDLDVMATQWLISDYNTLASPPADPPEVWYKFDEGTGKTLVRNHGTWGDEYDITVPGTDAPSWTSDVPGVLDPNDPCYAMDFDANDYLEIPNSPANQFVGTQNMTITAWVKPEASMGEWDFPSIVESRVDRGEATMKATGFGFGKWGELIYWWNNDYWTYSSGYYPAVGAWSFTAIAVEPTKGTLYYGDGNSVSASSNIAAHGALVDWDTTYTNYIGVNSNNADPNWYSTFQGKIDDLRLYNKTLPIGEIMGIAGVAGEVYVPNTSIANIAPKTPPPTNPDPNDPDIVNFLDYDVLAGNWLEQFLWP
ncbi:MAG: LamG domain-containing protein, partial [Planctomycetota bacterium]